VARKDFEAAHRGRADRKGGMKWSSNGVKKCRDGALQKELGAQGVRISNKKKDFQRDRTLKGECRRSNLG